MAWLTVDKGCPCKGCDRRLIGCHGLCPDYREWKVDYERVKAANNPPDRELSKSMKKHIWRKMLGR